VLLSNPIVYVRRAIDEANALDETPSKEANHFRVYQIHFLKIQNDRSSASLDLRLQLIQMFGSNSPNQPDCGGRPIRHQFDS
jgi:hypothetical protein